MVWIQDYCPKNAYYVPFVAELMKTISIDGWGSCTDKIQRLYPEVKAHSMENNVR